MEAPDMARARAALHSIPPDLPYDKWFKVGCSAIAAGLSINDIDTWSSSGSKYRGRQDVERTFRDIAPEGGTTAATLFYLAKKHGYQETEKHKLESCVSAPEKSHPPTKPSSPNPTKILNDIAAACEAADPSHPYIEEKLGLPDGLSVYRGSMTIASQNCDGALVLTLRDLDGNPVGMQFIPLEGKKVFLPKVTLPSEACLVIGGSLATAEKAYIVEGIGQAWAAHQATRAPAVVCCGKMRMPGVAKAIHAKHPRLLLVIVPDAGIDIRSTEVARAVNGIYVELPADWPSNYDISDFHKETGSLREVAALLESARAPTLSERNVAIQDIGDTLNDSGNAWRLVRLFGQDIRWLSDIKKWMTWNGQFWTMDEDGAVMRLAKQTAQSIYMEAVKETDSDKARKIRKWANTSHSLPRLSAMVELAKAELNISILIPSLDHNSMLLGTPSGVVDLTTGRLCKANRLDYITKTTNAKFQLDARCPNWEKFLDRCFSGNARVIEFIQRAVGYCLTGSTEAHVMFFLFGDGCNGKSVFLETIRGVLGNYAMQTQAETLMQKISERGANNDIARLRGARLVTAVEVEKGRRLAEPLIKQLTGGDQISARFLYGEFFEFKPAFKIWFASNDKPIIDGNDFGIWRRVLSIPFSVRIPEEEQDKQLVMKLAAEGAGILQWAIRGALEWRRIGLCAPPEITEATGQYQAEMDVFPNWFDECCRQGRGESARAKDLGTSHRNWAEQNSRRPLSQKELSKRLQAHGFRKEEDRFGIKYIGLSLL